MDQRTQEAMADQENQGSHGGADTLALGSATMAMDIWSNQTKCIGEKKFLKSPEGFWRVFRRSGHWRHLLKIMFLYLFICEGNNQ